MISRISDFSQFIDKFILDDVDFAGNAKVIKSLRKIKITKNFYNMK